VVYESVLIQNVQHFFQWYGWLCHLVVLEVVIFVVHR
jgi:hypothetical protein